MTMKEFAAMIKMDIDAFFDLSWEKCQALVKKHGYEFTNLGIFPIPGKKPKTEFKS